MMRTVFGFNGGKAHLLSIWRAVLSVAILASVLSMFSCSGGTGQTVQSGQATADAAASQAGAAAPEQAAALQIPSGTLVSVRLLSTVSSNSAKAGEKFDAELAAPLVVNGHTIFDKSARARVRVLSAEASGRLQNPGHLSITLDALQESNGNWESIDTTSLSLKGESHKKRNAVLIGGASAVGAAIGAIAGGGKGAAIGAGSGAGAGTAGAYATGKKDVAFSAETVLKFRTTSDITLDP